MAARRSLLLLGRNRWTSHTLTAWTRRNYFVASRPIANAKRYHSVILHFPVTASSLAAAAALLGYGAVYELPWGTTTKGDESADLCIQDPLDRMLATSSSSISPVDRLDERFLRWVQGILQMCWDTFLVSLRTTEVALRLSPLIVLTPTSMAAAQLINRNSTNWIADFAWWYTISTMQTLGPAWVKLMQWVATRRDVFPPNVCDRLSLFHDQAMPHDWNHTVKLLCQAFGDDYEKRGLHLQPDAVVGCGSAAQVYRGVLTETDGDGNTIKERSVAIKILHPNFKQNLERDLWLMETIAKLLDSLPSDYIRMISLPRATSNFSNVLRKQADLRVEAANLRQFRANFYRTESEEELSDICFPSPLDGWESEKVLVESYVADAIPIAHYLQDSTATGRQVRREISGPLLRAFLKMVFLDNFIHGDLHQGNVMVCTLPKKGKNTVHRRKIVFLDAGIATTLEPNDQKNLKDLFRDVILNDGNRAGRLMVERARYERCSQIEGGVDAFASGVQDIVSEFHDRRKEGLTLGAIRIGSLLSRVLDLCRIYGVEINPAMATVVLSTLVLEGLGRSLDPNLNLIEFAAPFLLKRTV